MRGSTSTPRRGSRAGTALLAIGALLVGCGGSDDPKPIVDVRPASQAERPAPDGVTSADRFAEPGWRYDTPEGWTPLPAAEMRKAGFRVAGDPAAECTLVVLPGTAGGEVANINRWRRQMGLEPVTATDIEALPRKTFLGQPAPYVVLEGTYQGMGGGTNLTAARLVGLLATLPRASVFAKLVGPGKVVEAETAHFLAFAQSVTFGLPPVGTPRNAAPGTPATGAPDGSARTDVPAGGEARSPEKRPIRFTLPAGWTEGPERPMRLATVAIAGAPGCDLSLSIFRGDVGSNVNRWRDQMGLEPLSADEMEKLGHIPVLGVEATVVDLKGTYRDMKGKETSDARFLGLIAVRTDGTVFVKLVGPAKEVEGEQERFLAFCRSLEVVP